jgi:hypothetical protein
MSWKLVVVRALYGLKGLIEDPEGQFRSLGVGKDDRILEIGCAIGYHTLPLARIARQGKVYAVDVWEEGLAHLETGRSDATRRGHLLCCQSALAFFRYAGQGDLFRYTARTVAA